MTQVTPLFDKNEPKPEINHFEEFWKWYPHNPKRRDKAKARAMFNKIVRPGGCDTRSENKDSGCYEVLHLEATPQEIVEGTKNYRKALIPDRIGEYSPDITYAPFAYVWLNGGRWE